MPSPWRFKPQQQDQGHQLLIRDPNIVGMSDACTHVRLDSERWFGHQNCMCDNKELIDLILLIAANDHFYSRLSMSLPQLVNVL
jgi:hypothetical protein